MTSYIFQILGNYISSFEKCLLKLFARFELIIFCCCLSFLCVWELIICRGLLLGGPAHWSGLLLGGPACSLCAVSLHLCLFPLLFRTFSVHGSLTVCFCFYSPCLGGWGVIQKSSPMLLSWNAFQILSPVVLLLQVSLRSSVYFESIFVQGES